jgi:hypothetical protein
MFKNRQKFLKPLKRVLSDWDFVYKYPLASPNTRAGLHRAQSLVTFASLIELVSTAHLTPDFYRHLKTYYIVSVTAVNNHYTSSINLPGVDFLQYRKS